MCSQALGLASQAADWTTATTPDFFCKQQRKVAAFASGIHGMRLGAASGVWQREKQVLVMMVYEELGGRN